MLLSQPLPAWLSSPIVPRFEQLGIFTTGEDESVTHDRGSNGVEYELSNGQTASFGNGTPHRAPNHVLINEYEPGQGIMPHEDGDAYAPVVATVSLGGHTVLDIYAKRDDRGLDNREAERQPNEEAAERMEEKYRVPGADTEKPRPLHRILQEPRSLLVTRGEAYRVFLHGIADVDTDSELDASGIANWDLLDDRTKYEAGTAVRQTRVSLTFRDVLKVSSVGSKLFGRR